MTAPVDPNRFEEMYRDERTAHGLPAATPWDIGGPQPVVQQLVSLGAIKGEVLDPGTGPGHHAIHYASKGLSTTGIDASPAAIERAKQNAQKAGVTVEFRFCRRDQASRDWTTGSTPSSTAPSTTFSAPSPNCRRLCAGPAPRHQARRAAVHVRVRRAQRERIQDAALAFRG